MTASFKKPAQLYITLPAVGKTPAVSIEPAEVTAWFPRDSTASGRGKTPQLISPADRIDLAMIMLAFHRNGACIAGDFIFTHGTTITVFFGFAVLFFLYYSVIRR